MLNSHKNIQNFLKNLWSEGMEICYSNVNVNLNQMNQNWVIKLVFIHLTSVCSRFRMIMSYPRRQYPHHHFV